MELVVDRLNTALAGHYVIERELGRGGMATVFLAHDLRHDRRVALKLVHPDLGALLGGERFLTEIRVTAKLQHPHILPLFDSGKTAGEDGILYYVMPYVDGESLHHRLTREGQLPIAEAVRIAVAVADALEYAHRHGVIHRDLKPENILLHGSPGSDEMCHPVVADFGLALAVHSAGAERLTQTGLSLGTPQYMSPEQATGDRRVDHRTDIYSLGAVLYQMLTGEPPHTGPNVQAIFAKLLTERPHPVRSVRDTVPQHVEEAVLRALAKLPADRFSSARELADALGGPASERVAAVRRLRSSVDSQAPSRLPARMRQAGLRLLPWGVAGLALGAVGWQGAASLRANDPHTARFVIPLGPGERVTDAAEGAYIAISHDGKHVVYVGKTSSGTKLFVRSLDEFRPRALDGTTGAKSPAVSPDGRWIAFVSSAKLRKVPIGGGPVVDLADVPQADFPSIAWPSDSLIVIGGTGERTGLSTVSAGGGPLRALTAIDSAGLQHVLPRVLDEESVLFTSWGPGDSQDDYVAIASLKTGKYTVLPLVAAAPVGVVAGHLIYTRSDGVVMAVRFDERRRRIMGDPVPVLAGVKPGAWPGTPAMASNGTIAYVGGGVRSTIVVADGSGSLPLLEEPYAYSHPRLSPDGRRLALQIESPTGTAVWMYDLPTKTLSRVTPELYNARPEWSPDGRRVLFWSLLDGRRAMGWIPVDGSGTIEPLVFGAEMQGVLTPDGKTLLYRSDDGRGHMEIGTLPVDTTGSRRTLIADGARNVAPRLSRDGRWMAYASDLSGQFEVYVRPFPGPGGRVQISAGGGTEPVWSRDGRQLVYRQGRRFMAATLAEDPQLRVTGRRILLEGDFFADVEHANYDVTPDGKILALAPAEDLQLTVVLNWPAELRRRVAGR